MSQISDPQALAKSSAVTAQGQAVLSQSESESAITYAVSAAAADLSQTSLPGDDKQLNVPVSVSPVVTASLAKPIVSSVTGSFSVPIQWFFSIVRGPRGTRPNAKVHGDSPVVELTASLKLHNTLGRKSCH